MTTILTVTVAVDPEDDRLAVWKPGLGWVEFDRAEFVAAIRADARAELQATFDVRWEADMRAIKRWQAAHPGNDLTWPDHADLVVWLLEQLEQLDPEGDGR